jgi:uncharacterized RDD family membrane protein YckC
MSLHAYAGFWLRFVAYIVDYIIIQVAQSIIIFPVLGMFGITFFSFNEDFDWEYMSEGEIIALIAAGIGAAGAAITIALVIQVLYYSLMEASKYQATVGKLVLGLKVTDMNGDALDFPKAFIRNLAKILSGMILMIGYIIAGFTDKKQALHDIIAGALVIRNDEAVAEV